MKTLDEMRDAAWAAQAPLWAAMADRIDREGMRLALIACSGLVKDFGAPVVLGSLAAFESEIERQQTRSGS